MRKFTFQQTRQGGCRAGMALAAAAMLMVLPLGACSTATVSSLPKELGGLPEDAPARPTTQLDYPAVHDMPPPRTKAVLTEEELKQAEAEMTSARDQQAKTPGSATSTTRSRR